MRRLLFPLILIAILIGAMFVLNQGMNKNVSKDHDDDDDQQQQTKTDTKPAAPVAASNAQDPLPAELTLGNPMGAKYHVTLGWVYDPPLLTHFQMLPQIVQQLKLWQSSHPDASLEVVDLDVPREDLSPVAASVPGLGLAVNGNSTFTIGGKPVDMGDNLGHGSVSPQNLITALNTVGAK